MAVKKTTASKKKATKESKVKEEVVAVKAKNYTTDADGFKYISKDDMYIIESTSHEAIQAKTVMHLYEQELAKLNLELELKKRDITSQLAKLSSQKNLFKAKNESVAKLLLKLKEKYEVTGEFAYDHLSGKLVQ